ncbi:MAG: hypothetical protein OQK51_19680, partial [Kangiellaceae bacterium]|nr:hypothetical protein [Kangiellaceae bacterium]
MTKNIIFLAVILFLQACTSNNRFTATGMITMPDNTEYQAIIYWDKLVGRTWYGARVDEPQSDVSLKICKPGITVKKFSQKINGKTLELKSRANDMRTKSIDNGGGL